MATREERLALREAFGVELSDITPAPVTEQKLSKRERIRKRLQEKVSSKASEDTPLWKRKAKLLKAEKSAPFRYNWGTQAGVQEVDLKKELQEQKPEPKAEAPKAKVTPRVNRKVVQGKHKVL